MTLHATDLQPLIQNVLHFQQSLFPGFDSGLEGFNEWGAPHRLGLNDLVVQIGLYVVNGGENGHP